MNVRLRLAALVVIALVVMALFACSRSDPAVDAGTRPALFGRPNDKTGLTADQCKPTCEFAEGGAFSPPTYDTAFVQALVTDWTMETPYTPLTDDPYAGPAPTEDPPDTVCAVIAGAPGKPRKYQLGTFPSEKDAQAAGAVPTHFGRCGVCSTLSNLAVYMRENDLAGPVRACGIAAIADGGDPKNVQCLQDLGFDLPCAQIWQFNTKHTREKCIGVCLAALNKPYHEPDGALNECVACDENESGPVFKAVAGRTRRNSGLPNALCRPCSEVRPLVHTY